MEQQEPARENAREELIDGGTVEALSDLAFHEAKHRADTARKLAFALFGLLAGSLLLHYMVITVLIVTGKDAALQPIQQLFNIWLPVIASLVSSAATYYFTKERS